jgi:glycosyltransferase involved in cell wall biosynthesis
LNYTVVLTTFNSSLTVVNAVESILSLLPPPYEVIIIDDASSDDTVDKIRALILGLPEVNLIINPRNRGQSHSRNLGVKESKTEFILLMDDDDYSYSNRAKLHLDALANGADISYVSSVKVYPNGYKVEVCNSNLTSSPKMSHKIIKHLVTGAPLANSKRVFSPSCSLAFKKISFLSINGFNEELRRLEDIEFACRALRSGLVLNWSSEIALERQYSIGEDKSAQANFDGEIAVLQSVRDHLGKKDYFVAKEMALFRKQYFEREYLAILKNSYILPLLILIAPRKVITVVNRLKHDISQRV